jgi:ribA/ribD-fused uncharacterized protein
MADVHPCPIGPFSGTFRFLSNFFPSPVEFEGLTYPTVEHAFQAAKTLNRAERERMRQLASPGEAKRAGRRLTLRPDWEEIKLALMEQLVRQKFADAALRARLLKTWPRPLVEENTWGDQFWGRCRGVGENHLGCILMRIRGGDARR